MKKNFNYCLDKVLKDEGGYTNDPSDSGGPTNFGITLGDYRKYINNKATAQDVKTMSVDQAKAIYRQRYWDSIDCDNLPAGVDYTCFDYAVNSGLGRPRKALQQFKSLQGTQLIDAINNERTAFLKRLATNQPKNQKFLKGWLGRVYRVDQDSKSLTKTDVTTGPVTGAGTVTIGVMLSKYFHQHQSTIIISSILAAIVIGSIVYYIKNKGKK